MDGLALRPWRSSDAPALAAAWADEAIASSLAPPDSSVAAATRWIDGWSERRDRGVALDLVIDVDGAVAGERGWACFEPRRGAALVGYWGGPDHRGQGLAARVGRATTAWFFEGLSGAALVARWWRRNVASVRTAERAGYVHVGAQDGSAVYVRRRPSH